MDMVFCIGLLFIIFYGMCLVLRDPECILFIIGAGILWVVFFGLAIPWKYTYKQTDIAIMKTDIGYIANTPKGLIVKTDYVTVSSTSVSNMVVIEKVRENLIKDSTYSIERK